MRVHMFRPGRRMKPSERIAIATRFRELEARGLTLDQMATLLGVDKRLLMKMRRARRENA